MALPEVTLTWTAAVDYHDPNHADDANFVLRRAPKSIPTENDYTTIATPDHSTRQYVDSDVNSGTTYTYQLYAKNYFGNGAFSTTGISLPYSIPRAVSELRYEQIEGMYRIALADPNDSRLKYDTVRVAVRGQVLVVDMVEPTHDLALSDLRVYDGDQVLAPRAMDSHEEVRTARPVDFPDVS